MLLKKNLLQTFTSFIFVTIPIVTLAQKQIIPQTGHSGSFVVSISHDDKQMSTAGIDGRLSIWNLEKTKAIKHIRVNSYPLLCTDWNSDSKKILTGGVDSILTQFDATIFAKIREFKMNFSITKAVFHPKLNAVAIGGNTGTVLVADAENGSVYHEINIGSYITGLEFSSTGNILFVSSWENGISAFEMKEGKKMVSIPITNGANTISMSVSKNDEIVVANLSNGTSEVINIFKAETLGSLENQPYYKSTNETLYNEPALTFENKFILNTNKDNNVLISNRFDNTQIIYNNVLSSGKINAIVPSNKGGFFIMTDADGSMCIIYFDSDVYKNELPLVWRKIQYVPERIFDVDFIQGDDVLALKGNRYYNFNMRTGDLNRRDNDSSKINTSDYFVRYVFVPENKDTYYYTDMIKHIGYEIKGNITNPLKAFAYSTDTNTLAFQTENNEITIYNIAKKKVIYRNKSTEVSQLFNGMLDNHFFFQKNNTLFRINGASGETKAIKLENSNPILYAAADTKNKTTYIIDNTGKIRAYLNETGKKLTLPLILDEKIANLIEISENGKYIAVSDNKGITVIDLASSKSVYEIKNEFGVNYAISMNNAGNRLAVANEDGIVRLYETEKKQLKFNLLASQQDGMLVYDENNYYMSTKLAARQLVIRDGQNIYSMENFDILYNRPDIILASIGLANEKMISAYKFAFERRLKKFNSKTTKTTGNLPQISLENKNEIKSSTILNEISLKFKVSTNEVSNAIINVWVNDVPVAHKTTSSQKDDFYQYINLKLVNGTNKIKYSLTNQIGIESDKEEIVVVNLNTKKPDLYLLTIGTSEYKDNKYNLTYAAKDANDITKQFSNTTNDAFGKVYTKTITNDQVTRESILDQLTFLKQANTNDVVIIFIAGHGVRDSEMKYYFGTNDMDFNSPETKGFSETDLATILDEIAAVRKLVFFDTCLSGEVDKDEVNQIAAVKATEANISFRSAGAGLRPKSIGLSNASALMREIYNDITDESGSTVISSAGGAEYAMESADWKNGLFTYCLLNGLKSMAADANKDKTITVHEIQDYLRKEVYKLSNGKQQPSFKSENKLMDFRIW
jgi:hypothetical protein